MTKSAKWTIFTLASICAALVVWIAAEPRVQAQAPTQEQGQSSGQVRSTQPSLAIGYPTRTAYVAPGQTVQGAPALPGQAQSTLAPIAGRTMTTQTGQGPGALFSQAPTVVTGHYFNPSHPFATTIRGSSPEEQKLVVQTQQLLQKLREGDEENDEDELKSKLRDVLVEHFDLRMSKREEELEKLEERLDKLRDELSNRRSAKNDIVDLRHQSLVNEAQGLGF